MYVAYASESTVDPDLTHCNINRMNVWRELLLTTAKKPTQLKYRCHITGKQHFINTSTRLQNVRHTVFLSVILKTLLWWSTRVYSFIWNQLIQLYVQQECLKWHMLEGKGDERLFRLHILKRWTILIKLNNNIVIYRIWP